MKIDYCYINQESKANLGALLLGAYFFLSISYAHLPLATIHHSLGSAFNYVFMVIFLYCLLSGRGRIALNRPEVNFISFIFTIIGAAWLMQLYHVYMLLGMDGNLRSLTSVISSIASYFALIIIIGLARRSDFTFVEMSQVVFWASVVLSLYLVVEIIGIRYSLEPFSSIVDIVSEYLNYRDEARQSGGRVRGFTNEPSYLAVVIIFLISILLVDKSRSKIVNYWLVFFMVAISSAAVSKNLVVGLSIVLFIHALYFRRLLPFIIMVVAILVFYFFYSVSQIEGIQWQYDAYDVDFSTITRVGSWVAALAGFVDSPLIGNGFGLAGGLIAKYYPDWFYISPEALDWESASVLFASPVFSYTFRIIFEMGVLGFIYIIGLFLFLIRISNNRSFLSHDNFLLMAGLFVSFLMLDAMSFWPFYAALAIKRDIEHVR